MKIRKAAVATLAALGPSLLWGSLPPAAPAFQVVVYDAAGVPAPILDKALDNARGLFGLSGIETVWSVCRRGSTGFASDCRPPRAPRRLQVVIVPDRIAPVKDHNAMGFALTSPGRLGDTAYVFVEPAQILAFEAETQLAEVLGCVVVHEVGHLLGLKHTPTGIMKPTFLPRDIRYASCGRLHFTDEEASALRDALH